MKDIVLVVLDADPNSVVSTESPKKPFTTDKPGVIPTEIPVVLHSEKGHHKHGFNRISERVITQDGRR